MVETWIAFIDEYKDCLPFHSLEDILKAFYYYEGNKSECDRVFGISQK